MSADKVVEDGVVRFRPRALMTLADVAWPVDAGKRLRSESMLRALAADFDVDVVVLFADADPATAPVPPGVAASWAVVPPEPLPKFRAGAAAARRLVPWQIAVCDWGAARTAIARARGARDRDYDLVWFGSLDHFVSLRDDVAAESVVVDCDDVETVKLRGFLSLSRHQGLSHVDWLQRRVELPLWGRIQRRVVRSADRVLVCSPLDRQRLVEQAAGRDGQAQRVVPVPNTYPDPGPRLDRDLPEQCVVSMIANYGTDQNVDAVAFAVARVLPLLRRRLPGARLRVAGRRPDRLAEFAGIEGLDIVGPIESVAAELRRVHAVLVPMRFGGGTRLKIIEAMAFGVPVVSTTLGAEGLTVRDGTELVIADAPERMVDAVANIFENEDVGERLILAGRRRYEHDYRPDATIERVRTMLRELVPEPSSTAATPGGLQR